MNDTKYVWLKCHVIDRTGHDCIVEVNMLDATPVTVKVHSTLLRNDGKSDYVRVEDLGKKNKLVYIKLPQPSLNHGHYITVKQEDVKND